MRLRKPGVAQCTFTPSLIYLHYISIQDLQSLAMSSDPPDTVQVAVPLPSAPVVDTAADQSHDIRRQVEQEQALADAEQRVKALEAEVEKEKIDRQRVEDERNGAGG
jgi:hypothetical protein